MVLGIFGGNGGITQMLLSFVMLMAFFLLFPRLMIFQVLYKIRSALTDLEDNAQATEDLFVNHATTGDAEATRKTLEPMKNMVVSPPVSMDPAGMFDKMEHVLDSSEDKMQDYVDTIAPGADERERANLTMAFKGVYGTNQLYVLIRHFKNLIEETSNYQLGGMIKMMLPLYKEMSDSQKKAAEAFVNEVPIGDTVGPMVAASLMHSEPKEAGEDIVYSEEELDGNEYIVVKSNGPAASLGKYGDAVEELVEDNDISTIITVDAGMRYEGEETGTVVDGTGVLMGGPGVEKGKIEAVATDNDIPLEGYVIKQSGPEASKPMHRKIWDGKEDALAYVRDDIRNQDGTTLVVGVGNTCGAGNSRESLEGLEAKLQPYWAEQEEESPSYFGLMKAFPVGGGGDMHPRQHDANTFELFQRMVR